MPFSFIKVSVRCPLDPSITETIEMRAADLPDGGILFPPDYPGCDSYHGEPSNTCNRCRKYVTQYLMSIRSAPGLVEPPVNLSE